MNFIPSRYETLPPNTKNVLALFQNSDEEKEGNEIKELNGKDWYFVTKIVFTYCEKKIF